MPIDKAAKILRREVPKYKTPIVTEMSAKESNPFKILISTLLSLRTKDECTGEASKRLFKRAKTPRGMLRLDEEELAEIIYPVGFYNTKARTIQEVCRVLLDEHGGEVPDELDELLALKGVGRKTANLVLTRGFHKPGICVDTHVHRITNRWGYVDTDSPDETEMVLRDILPDKYWIEINDWLVTWGQNVCKPTSPICSKCDLESICPKIGVKRSR
ncbi:MAG: endonuclease III domain-containing protein [Candidatus Sumerlaeota bacterium]